MKLDTTNAPLSKLNDTVLSALDKHAPTKMKYIRSNNSNSIDKGTEERNYEHLKFKKYVLKIKNRGI